LDELNRILGQSYHAVVGNPPYITVKDAALNQTYRKRFASCHRQYSLGVPFTERFFELAKNPSPPAPLPKGRGEEDNASLSPSHLGERGWGEGAGKVFKTRTSAELSPILTEFAHEMRHAPTDAEGRLWYFLRNRRMAGHKFRRQHQIGHYIVDFVCVDAHLAIEIDGGQHAEPEGHQRDQTRDQFLRGRGLEVLRFWNHEVLANTDAVLEKIWLELHPSYPSPQPLSPRGEGLRGEGAGYVGMITANSFMKREFGKKLIEQFFPRIDLTHVIDTAGAYIPGHGTPTVILLGRNRPPVISSIRTVMGIKGEPSTPANPAQGLVWSAIVKQVDSAGSESAFVSVANTPRTTFAKHPWSIGGGGMADLKEMIEMNASGSLEQCIDLIGFVCMTRADDVYFIPRHSLLARGVPAENIIVNVEGDCVRDWAIIVPNTTLFPYDDQLQPLPFSKDSRVHQLLWPYRTPLWLRREIGGNHLELGMTWWEWNRFQRERYLIPLAITLASVATHNHFVLDRGGKVFKQSAPVIKLPAGATEDEHQALLGLLNSSVACFWLKQVCHDKGNGGIGGGIASEAWERFHDFTATKLAEFPLADPAPTDIARRLDQLARQRAECLPANVITLVPKLLLGNADREAPASQPDKQSLQAVGSQAGASKPLT